MKKLLRFSLWALAAIVCAIVLIAVYLRNADLSVYEDQIESYLSERVGHRLDIDGRFELQVRSLTRLTAEKITVTNSAWPKAPAIVSVGHLSIAIDLWSLVSGPVIVEDLDIRDVAIHLERNVDGRANWTTGRPPSDEPGDVRTDLIAFRDIKLERATVSYVDPQRPRPIEGSLAYLNVAPDPDDILDLAMEGALNEFPLRADGKLGPWQNLLDGRDLAADLALTLGQVRLVIEGTVEDALELEGVEASFSLTGPSIERLTERLGLPPFAQGEFDLDGTLRKLDGGNDIQLQGQLGEIRISADGTVDSLRDLQAAAIKFDVAGPDAKYVSELLGVSGVPQVTFQLTGDLQQQDRRISFSDTLAQLGDNRVTIEGWTETRADGTNLELAIDAAGPDFSVFAPFVGFAHIPALAFEIDGSLKKSGADWQFDGVRAAIGENRIEANGSIVEGEDTQVVFRASGPDNTVLQALTGLKGLPPRPFDISAQVRPDIAGIRLEDAAAIFGEIRIELQGIVGTGQGLTGTRLKLNGTGPELRDIALLTGVPHLPGGDFEIGGEIQVDRDSLLLRAANARVGDLRASASGSVGIGSKAGEFDLTVSGTSPNAASLADLGWLQEFEGEVIQASGRIQHRGDDFALEAVELSLGSIEASLNGSLSVAPRLNDSDLEFTVTGPDLDHVVSAFGLEIFFPAKPFGLKGRFDGTPTGFEMREFTATIGDNDISGQFTAQLTGKPTFTGELSSTYLDLTERLEQMADSEAEADDDTDGKREFFFSNEPIAVDWMESFDADVSLTVDRLMADQASISELQLGVVLQDGALSVAPIAFREHKGRLEGHLRVIRQNGSYELDAKLDVDNVRLGVLGRGEEDRSKRSPIDGTVALKGSGNSLHEIMASSNGRVSVRQGAGRIRNRENRLFGDLVLEIIRTLNPLRSKDEYRRLDCGIYEVDIEDGVATLTEIAIQTDTLTTVASGNVNLDTEEIDVVIRTKPREGIGISIGGITASLLKVGGTLQSPGITLDTKSAATTTGVAVATGGLSLLAKGLADRLTAEADICKQKEPENGEQADVQEPER